MTTTVLFATVSQAVQAGPFGQVIVPQIGGRVRVGLIDGTVTDVFYEYDGRGHCFVTVTVGPSGE